MLIINHDIEKQRMHKLLLSKSAILGLMHKLDTD